MESDVNVMSPEVVQAVQAVFVALIGGTPAMIYAYSAMRAARVAVVKADENKALVVENTALVVENTVKTEEIKAATDALTDTAAHINLSTNSNLSKMHEELKVANANAKRQDERIASLETLLTTLASRPANGGSGRN